MKLIYRKIYNQHYITLICVSLMISSMQGIALCNCEDGHVAVKHASSVCCDKLYSSISSEESTTPLEEAYSSSKDNCGPCVDIPISVQLSKVYKKPNLLKSTRRVSAAIIPAAISCCVSEYRLGLELSATGNSSLVFLRTIILLT